MSLQNSSKVEDEPRLNRPHLSQPHLRNVSKGISYPDFIKRKAEIQKEPTWSHQENDLLHIAEMYVPDSTYRIWGITTGRFSSLVLDLSKAL
jgi:hypothetical protein